MTKQAFDIGILNQYIEHAGVDDKLTWDYKRWVSAMGLEDDKNYFSLMSEVVKWNNLYHDELIYSLVTLLIFFSRNPTGWLSERIEKIHHHWRSLLFRYIQSLNLTEDVKNDIFSGALNISERFSNMKFPCIRIHN